MKFLQTPAQGIHSFITHYRSLVDIYRNHNNSVHKTPHFGSTAKY